MPHWFLSLQEFWPLTLTLSGASLDWKQKFGLLEALGLQRSVVSAPSQAFILLVIGRKWPSALGTQHPNDAIRRWSSECKGDGSWFNTMWWLWVPGERKSPSIVGHCTAVPKAPLTHQEPGTERDLFLTLRGRRSCGESRSGLLSDEQNCPLGSGTAGGIHEPDRQK